MKLFHTNTRCFALAAIIFSTHLTYNKAYAAPQSDNAPEVIYNKQTDNCMTESHFFMVTPDNSDKQELTGLTMLFNNRKIMLGICFDYLFGEQIINQITAERARHKDCQIMARITFSNGEWFASPVLQIQADDTVIDGFISIEDATFSSAVEEIGTDRFNAWSTLKYLASRLARHDIAKVEIACDPADADFHSLLQFSCTAKTSKFIREAFEAMGNACGTHDFYHYSWE